MSGFKPGDRVKVVTSAMDDDNYIVGKSGKVVDPGYEGLEGTLWVELDFAEDDPTAVDWPLYFFPEELEVVADE